LTATTVSTSKLLYFACPLAKRSHFECPVANFPYEYYSIRSILSGAS
jgi:hypothetical protein